MGFGDFPAGTTLAGMDALVLSRETRPTPPAALAFDGLRKDYVLDEHGHYRAAHPVDAKVFLIMRVAEGSIRSAMNVGNKIKTLRYIEPQRIRAQIEDLVRVKLEPLVRAREIRQGPVDIELPSRGAALVRVNYVNLLTQKPERAELRVM